MALGDKTLKLMAEELEVWDAHTHIGPSYSSTIRQSGAEDVIKYMDRLGFKKSIVSSLGAIGDDFVYGNNDVDKATKKYPDKLLGYITVNPNYPEGTIKEIERLRKNKNFVGIKIHPYYSGVAVNAKCLEEVYAYAHEMHSLVLVHTWSDGEIAGLTEVSEKYPEMRLIMAHAGALTGTARCAEAIKTHKNLYCDFCMASAGYGIIETLVKKGSADKILFGTDSTLADPRVTYGRLLFSDISDSDKIKIFSENIKRILTDVEL